MEVLQKSAFSVRERTVYFTKKWNREHRFEMILWAALYLAAGVLAWIFDQSWIAPVLGPAAVVIVIWMKNRRSCYVEGKLYGSGAGAEKGHMNFPFDVDIPFAIH